MSLVVVVLLGGGMHRRIIKMEGKAKVVAAGLGDVTLMPHYNHLAARMIRRKVFWENIYFGRLPSVGVSPAIFRFATVHFLTVQVDV